MTKILELTLENGNTAFVPIQSISYLEVKRITLDNRIKYRCDAHMITGETVKLKEDGDTIARMLDNEGMCVVVTKSTPDKSTQAIAPLLETKPCEPINWDEWEEVNSTDGKVYLQPKKK